MDIAIGKEKKQQHPLTHRHRHDHGWNHDRPCQCKITLFCFVAYILSGSTTRLRLCLVAEISKKKLRLLGVFLYKNMHPHSQRPRATSTILSHTSPETVKPSHLLDLLYSIVAAANSPTDYLELTCEAKSRSIGETEEEGPSSCNIAMVLADDNIAQQTGMMPEFSSLDDVFLSPGIRLSNLDTRRAGPLTLAMPSNSTRVGVETEDVGMKDDDSKGTIRAHWYPGDDEVDDGDHRVGDSKRTIAVRASSSEGADGNVVTMTAGSKESLGGSPKTATSRTSSCPDKANGSKPSKKGGANDSVVGSGSSVVSKSSRKGSQESSMVPPALNGPAELRESTGASGENSTNTHNDTSTNKRRSSVHDLSAASYLARHKANTAQNQIVNPVSNQQPAAASPTPTLPPIQLPTPAAECSKLQTITYENRTLQYQTIEAKFQALWTRRENFLEFFFQTHNATLSVDDQTEIRTEEDDKRRDSVVTKSQPTTIPLTLPTLLPAARHRALELLLEAWFERLGTPSSNGWTRYSEKTTPGACLALRGILSKGDTHFNIPPSYLPPHRHQFWTRKLRSVDFWFTSPNQAVDFLSAFGIGEARVGSGVSRVEVLQYSRKGTGGKCLSPEHHESERAWRARVEEWRAAGNSFPPLRYCPCSEYKLLMKILGNAQRLPEPGGERAIRWMSRRLTGEWQRANLARGVDVARDWPSEVGRGRNFPAKLSFGGVGGFELWHCLGRDEGRGVLLRAVRLEGRFAELL